MAHTAISQFLMADISFNIACSELKNVDNDVSKDSPISDGFSWYRVNIALINLSVIVNGCREHPMPFFAFVLVFLFACLFVSLIFDIFSWNQRELLNTRSCIKCAILFHAGSCGLQLCMQPDQFLLRCCYCCGACKKLAAFAVCL